MWTTFRWRQFHYLRGDADPAETISRVGNLIRHSRVDLALVGIGENGHLAFNDPPADFDTEEPYLMVELDEPCRMQQVGEGWFQSLDDVPTHAISMSVRQILKSATIYCSVPDQRKAEAVRNTLEGPITPEVPASILRTHGSTTLVIDEAAATDLAAETRQCTGTCLMSGYVDLQVNGYAGIDFNAADLTADELIHACQQIRNRRDRAFPPNDHHGALRRDGHQDRSAGELGWIRFPRSRRSSRGFMSRVPSSIRRTVSLAPTRLPRSAMRRRI